MEQISEYTQFIQSLQKELAVPLLFRKQLYEKLGEKVTGLSYEQYEEGMEKMQRLRSQTYNLLSNAKIFILEEDIAQMLYLTDNEIFKREIPFDNFFLETSFELEYGNIVKGIHIFKEEISGFILGAVRIYNQTLQFQQHYTLHFDLFAKKLEVMDSNNKLINSMNKPEGIGVLKDKKIQTFICNFLDFLNDPEVELRTIERTEEQNKKRIKRGKFAIPPINFIRVTGKLKIYQDSISTEIHFSYSHKFWVRGHFRTLQDMERYGERAGKRVWIKPYVKGKGILLDKDYKLKKEAKQDGTD
jgi:hypothetical protein|tara:strand:- start:116 stop:1018 length:903 start_codon:yes stop_codon:yes gene_type:complete